MQSKPYYQLVPYRLLGALLKNVKVRIGEQILSIPTKQVGTLACLYWHESWKSRVIDILLRSKEGAFVDVGANVGQTLLDVLAVAPSKRYIGLEPNPVCVHFLERVIEGNALDNCTILPVGLWEKPEVLLLYLQENQKVDASATIRAELRPNRAYLTRYVPCFPFDDVWVAIGTPSLSLIKIDVEGAELEVIQGMQAAIRRETPAILCEVLYLDSNADLQKYSERVVSLMQLLESLGYWVFRVDQNDNDVVSIQKLEQFPVIPWSPTNAHECDYLFLHRDKMELFRPLLTCS